ncbi:hypothetical protein T265_02556 [Opisthorchis viverrini]|uniref:Uncharacterized protein n=1 Tax=Opisthorchis viverrini TaxID=6198 RepID=A0A074ZVE3_OPIVI|nr:hypothetical protein T265_02556 [Opisthorchis viverrini]KER31101.1 hypothetical protein T265_02556 [Opisthorchis viverrini]
MHRRLSRAALPSDWSLVEPITDEEVDRTIRLTGNSSPGLGKLTPKMPKYSLGLGEVTGTSGDPVVSDIDGEEKPMFLNLVTVDVAADDHENGRVDDDDDDDTDDDQVTRLSTGRARQKGLSSSVYFKCEVFFVLVVLVMHGWTTMTSRKFSSKTIGGQSRQAETRYQREQPAEQWTSEQVVAA